MFVQSENLLFKNYVSFTKFLGLKREFPHNQIPHTKLYECACERIDHIVSHTFSWQFRHRIHLQFCCNSFENCDWFSRTLKFRNSSINCNGKIWRFICKNKQTKMRKGEQAKSNGITLEKSKGRWYPKWQRKKRLIRCIS